MAGSLWPFSTGLPWQLELLQDSVVSADKEEEAAVPMKARKTFHTLTPSSILLLTQFSQVTLILLTEESTLILGHMLFFLQSRQVWIVDYNGSMFVSKTTTIVREVWYAGLSVSREHQLH